MGEQKLFYTVCATLLIYGLSSYMELGSFVLPLPFFEIGLFILCVYFAVSQWDENPRLSILFLLYGIAQFLSFSYNYSFFLSDQKLENVANSLLTDVFQIAAHLVLVVLFLYQNKSNYFRIRKTIFRTIALCMFVCLFFPTPLFLLFPLSFLIFLFQKQAILFSQSLSFWLYVTLFLLSRELSLYFL